MSSRSKRKFDLDPNASDPEDSDYDEVSRAPQQRRRHNRRTPGGTKKKTAKRHRHQYSGSDVDDDDEIVSDDSFTDRSSSEEPEVNPATGRAVRRATKKEVHYEESAEEIEDTPNSTSDEDKPVVASKRRSRAQVAQPSIEHVDKPSLIVKFKMPANYNSQTRSLRARTGSKSFARGKTPEVAGAVGTRRSSRISHDREAPIIALSDSGKHANIVREGTRSPEPVIARATRGGKGPVVEHPSIIMEASQETSMIQDDDSGPIDDLLADVQSHVEASKDGSPELNDQGLKDEEDDGQDGVIQESQNANESDDEEGPITRGGRNLRSRATPSKRKRGADESSDFDPADIDAEGEDEEMSDSDHEKGKEATSDSGSGSGRQSKRLRNKSQRSRRNSSSEEEESAQDERGELQDELDELGTNKKRRRISRRLPDNDIQYDNTPKRRRRQQVDYRVVRPEQNAMFDNDDDDEPVVDKSRSRTGRGNDRTLFSNAGPFGGGHLGMVGMDDSDSSDDENQMVPRPYGDMVGMTPTAANAPGFGGFPQTHNADSQQNQGTGGGPANLGKVKDKKALADADPLGVDPNVNFDGVGGLDDHINKLKEMVMLPLLYPEVFQRFKITPPRGVLFHGPPGTGKTLLARALASSVSSHGQKVTFYMRKGADALSKWVGEAERQLRLLFEEARKTQPSIIFFDEIDGLAPVRSSKQEQIHASIVATLLALMDGMDGRGQVIVIGATNRPDSVDPALRRPGRFDREFYFPLPSVAGRRAIIDIHTKNWEPPLKPEMKDGLAELTKGYGGADLRALCTEAALNAVQGTFPQIYSSEKKLLIDPSQIKILAKDFMISVNKMVPSSQRTVTASAAPLPKNIEPLLRGPLAEILRRVDELIPRRKKLTALEEAEFDDRDDEKGFEREATMRNFESSRIFRPRLLISGLQGMGQSYIGAALLNKIEGLHVQSFDLPTILEDATRSPEAAITQLFTEVRRHKPSVIYIPSVDVWYETLPAPAIRTFKLLLRSLGANEPIMLLGVIELLDEKDKPDRQMMADLFSYSRDNQYNLPQPDTSSREEFFSGIVNYVRMSPADFPDPDNRKKRVLPELEAAPIIEPVIDPKVVAAQRKWQEKQDRMTLNRLKIAIQPIMDHLKKSFRRFYKPILDESWYSYLLDEEDPVHFTTDLDPAQQQEQGLTRPWERSTDSSGVGVLLHVDSGNKYYNLDLSQIEKRLSNGYYKRPRDFLFDIKTLAKDAKTYEDPERTLKGNEMVSNVEVDIETLFNQGNPALVKECEALYQRELERIVRAKEKRQKAIAQGQTVPAEKNPAPAESNQAAGAITLGEPVPRGSVASPVTPSRLPMTGPTSNGTSAEAGAEENSHTHSNGVDGHDGPDGPSRVEDSEMVDSQDLSVMTTNTDFQFQTPNKFGTQVQKSQLPGRTFIQPGSFHQDYHNSASTTTSGNQTSKRSSDKFSTQSTTNGVAPTGAPDFADMMPSASGGSQLPDTQGALSSFESRITLSPPMTPECTTDLSRNAEQPFANTQLSNSQPSQSSMPAPAAPRHTTNLSAILNEPQLLLDEGSLSVLQQKLVRKSSGCSLEQLEQINASLMDAIWQHRREYNRNVVIKKVADAFDSIIMDIEAMQDIRKPSQEIPEESDRSYVQLTEAEHQQGPFTQDEPYGARRRV